MSMDEFITLFSEILEQILRLYVMWWLKIKVKIKKIHVIMYAMGG